MLALLDLSMLRCLDDARAIRQELDILAHLRRVEEEKEAAGGRREGGARGREEGGGDERAPARGRGDAAPAGAAPALHDPDRRGMVRSGTRRGRLPRRPGR